MEVILTAPESAESFDNFKFYLNLFGLDSMDSTVLGFSFFTKFID